MFKEWVNRRLEEDGLPASGHLRMMKALTRSWPFFEDPINASLKAFGEISKNRLQAMMD